MEVLKIRKVRNKPFYNMQVEIEDSEEKMFIIEGMNILLREMKSKAVAVPIEKFEENEIKSFNRYDMSDEEAKIYINIGVVAALCRGVGLPVPSTEKMFPE